MRNTESDVGGAGDGTGGFSRSKTQPPHPDQDAVPALGTCIWPVLSFVPCSPQAVAQRLLPLLTQAAGNDSQTSRSWGSQGPLPRMQATWRPLPWGGGSRRTSPCGQGGPYHPTLGLQATEGVMEAPSPLPPPPALLCSAFSLRRGCPSFPASHSILMPALPAWVAKDTRGGVITGHSSPRVRTEEAQPSAGTHQSPNQALAAGRKGRAAHGKGVPANFS